jgi:hypothetical protein
MSHNKKIDELISNVLSKAKQAKNNQELLNSVKILKDFNGEIKYKFTLHISFIILGILMIAGNIYYTENYIRYSTPADFIFAGLGLIFSITFITMIFLKKSNLDSLSSYIYKKDTLQDNKLTEISVNDNLFNYLYKNFKNEFNRGNHKRYFQQAYQSKREFFRDYQFQLFQFHYVNSRIETTTSTDSKGNVTISTRTVYDHYNRYGFVMDFDYFKNIEVKSNGSVAQHKKYNTGSISFDKYFNLGSNDELNLAKFLSPVVVEAFIKLSNSLSGFNLEIDSKGKLCITCDDSSLFISESQRKYGVQFPEEFLEELEGFTNLNTLEAIFEFLYILNKEHD